MKLYEIYDRETGLGFSKFDNMNGYAPVWKAKPKQYKSYPIVRENLYELLDRWHIAKAQICQIELDQVLELPYDAPEPGTDKLNGATIFVLLDKAAGKYFCTSRGFDTNMMGAKVFESIGKARASVNRKADALNKRLAKTAAMKGRPGGIVEYFKPAFMGQILGDLENIKDTSNWVILGFAEKRTWLPQSVAVRDSGVDMDWD